MGFRKVQPKSEIGAGLPRANSERQQGSCWRVGATGYNSEYRDHPFATKRDMENGFASSPLRLNRGLGQTPVWNEEAMVERATRRAREAVSVWPAPALPNDVLDAYRENPSSTSSYSIADHPHLSGGLTRHLFDAFRQEILALDEGVREEFLKLYVAYKAETNFVDVVPQASSLRISLNTRFSDVVDPRGRCRDVTSVGRWGNGEVEVRIESLFARVLGRSAANGEGVNGGGRAVVA